MKGITGMPAEARPRASSRRRGFAWLPTRGLDPEALARAFSGLSVRAVLFALALMGAAHAVRIVRWWWMLRALEPDLPVAACISPFLASMALNNLLPLRAGDALRVRAALHPGVVPDVHASRFGAVGDDGARVGSGAGRVPGTDALAVRSGPLDRHRLTGRFHPKSSRSGLEHIRVLGYNDGAGN